MIDRLLFAGQCLIVGACLLMTLVAIVRAVETVAGWLS